jgi:diguanylate cyclase (GGDEF)-like protein
MSRLIDRLVAHGGAALIEQGQSLAAQIDRGGRLVEWNPSLQQILDLVPNAASLFDLLDSSSRPRLVQQIAEAIANRLASAVILNFSAGPADLPRSYSCHLLALPSQQLIMLAEPLAPLDPQAAQEYMRVTNDLAMTTRNLQKTRYELTKKQHLLEEALQRLERIARVDELTQTLSRRSIMGYLRDEIDRAARYPASLSIMLLDVDHFKQVNDCYGHQVGDEVLRATAGLLQQSIRATDHLGRYGGEEFLAILPMTEPASAAELAERLRRRIRAERYTAAGSADFCVTISIGIAGFDYQADTLETLIAHADGALYQAKTRGRDRFFIWQP